MTTRENLLNTIRGRIAAHARPDLHTSIDGLLLSAVTEPEAVPEYSLTEPILVVMAQGGKRLSIGNRTYEYRAGDCLVVTADLPVTGHYLDVAPGRPALSLGLTLRPSAVADLVLRMPSRRSIRTETQPSAIATGPADHDLLDAVCRLTRLLDRPADAPVLAPLIEQEILWRALTGPLGDMVRQIGLADSDLTHIGRVVTWIRDHYAEPIAVEQLARLAGMSSSTLHRRFRTVTALSPVQFQKQIRLQHARSLLLSRPGDVAAVGHAVGYDSASQFTREYRRMYGAPPGRDSRQLRAEV
ncbi:AraC family transcriptional regulator [Mycobacterium sp. MS1601]|uniref:AraC family transcriptional regulator n=1 Tax=Mycobacterium sp. MS1601 TaxID=1936029 RepID=UPI0009792146|nr:AraC family transcriptional regulator [Mycobacterium sp. MS1601]AQA05532.1 AraC family transcriptional regulator [Mycobacterium sp. MS1601]